MIVFRETVLRRTRRCLDVSSGGSWEQGKRLKSEYISTAFMGFNHSCHQLSCWEQWGFFAQALVARLGYLCALLSSFPLAAILNKSCFISLIREQNKFSELRKLLRLKPALLKVSCCCLVTPRGLKLADTCICSLCCTLCESICKTQLYFAISYKGRIST